MNKFSMCLSDCKSVFIKFLLALCICSSFLHGKSTPQKPIVILIPSYNNSDWFEKNLDSVFMQDYDNYRVIYLNDNSRDNTGQKVEEYLINANIDYRTISFDDSECLTIPEATEQFVKFVNEEQHFVTLINNVNRCGALANLYRGVNACDDKEIVVTLDGDDWLLHSAVLTQLNKIYTKKKVWFTHGKLVEYPGGNTSWCEPVPSDIVKRNAFREFKCPSHLRTFYAWIFKKIKLEDLLFEGKFFAMTWDMAIMFPIAEMAGNRHAFILEPNYVYNMANQINDNKVNADLQNFLDAYIRNKTRYKRLKGS